VASAAFYARDGGANGAAWPSSRKARAVSVVKINVLSVSPEARETLERRFAGRAGAVEASDGFEWFELLRPLEGTDQYLVYTRWRSEDDFQKWQLSQDFARGHAGGAEGAAPPRPAAHASQVWSFEVLQQAGPKNEA
jgi:heme-degrading monooxygenase HmoA